MATSDWNGEKIKEDEVECFGNISRAIENIKKGYILKLIVIQKITIRFI